MVEDFSLGGEQAHIIEAFRGSPPGKFLDLGAFHPWLLSNTRALYLAGWSGVVVDVSPLSVRSLIDEYGKVSRVTVVQGAIGMNHGLVDLHSSDDAVTTSSDAMYERWGGTLQFNGKLTAAIITLEDIAAQFGAFDFVSIDTEGTSFDLFRRAMELGWRPLCVCCESDDRPNEMQSMAYGYGYRRVFKSDENGVFVR